jgi:clan AA aspartic protease (TIGR02281 family)
MRRLARCLGLLLALAPFAAEAEIYQWTDEQGQVHYTQDLNQVPARHRSQAELRAQAPHPEGRLQTYSEPAAPDPGSAHPRQTGAQRGREFRIPVARAGIGMIVYVRLDDRLTTPFLVDTGATDVLIPASVAEQLGIHTGSETRTKSYQTANGVVTHSTVMLRSVDLGGAIVENVPASISPSMEIGLLGLSFFNHFTYNVDAAAGILTLVPNDLVESGAIRGGRSEAQWRAEYQDLRARIEQIDREADAKSTSKARSQERLEEQRGALQGELSQLDAEADVARVPMGWRE